MGQQFTGMAVTRRYYEQFFKSALGRIRGFVMHGEAPFRVLLGPLWSELEPL